MNGASALAISETAEKAAKPMNADGDLGSPRFNLQMLGPHVPDRADEVDDGSKPAVRTLAEGRRILVVEDDYGIRDVLCTILEEHGYAVASACNGDEALRTLRGGRAPDLIVLDLRMPVMDGWQFRAAQKADPALAAVPVLALSADGSAKAEAIDAAAYIRKPLSTEALLGAIARILSDVERKRLLGRMAEVERLAAQGRLAASIAHEINNPLAYVSLNLEMLSIQIKGYLQAQARALESLPAVPVMLDECRDGLGRIRDLVKNLVLLSLKSAATRERASLNALLDEALESAGNHVRARATVRKDYGDIPAVVGERSALVHVLLNLILNAAQALPEGHGRPAEIALRTYVDGDHVTAEVCDSGPGIPAQVLPHIFDPFFSTKAIGEGTGLGLSVAFRIVADHGGRIDVETKVGRGSAFRVVLPAAVAEAPVRVPGE
jgi:signal transduction histidine kinase